jgi:aryl-alcohol dehydrogenase-like predicted oxidoreductase
MQYAHLGRAGLRVSRLCLGTMNFGPYTSEEDACAIMDASLEVGINFFDTANVYGRRIPPRSDMDPGRVGWTEEIIGRWWSQGGERRDKTIIATKLYGDMKKWPNFGRLSALNVKRACEASLRRLQTDYIDLYQMHHVDRDTPWDEIWQAMEQLVQEGKVLYVGSSNFAGWHVAQACEAARSRHFLGLVSEQSLYNLLERTVELEVIPACLSYGVGVIPWSPVAGGLLGGVLAKAAEGRRASGRVQMELDQHRPAIEAYEALCGRIGEKPADVALAWLLSRPGVTAPIIGPRTREQLDDAVHALDIDLDAEVVEELEGIFPGPGGPAPEAYAW